MRINAAFVFLILLQASVANGTLQAQIDKELADHYMERAQNLYDRSDYDSLPIYYSKARKIFQRTGPPVRIAECILGMSEYYQVINNLVRAEAYLDTAMLLIEDQVGLETGSWSDALYIKAKLLWGQNRLPEALDNIVECLDLRIRLNSGPQKIARAQNILGAIYYFQGDYLNAEKYYRQALQLVRQQSQGPSILKGLLQFNLSVVYGRVEEKEKWLAFLKMAVETNIAVYGEDFPDLAKSYSSFSSYYISNGQIDSARHYLDKAENLYIRHYDSNYYELNEIYSNWARILKLEGNFSRALEYYGEAERILKQNRQGDDYQSDILCINTGNLYRQLGEYQMAQNYYEKLLSAEGVVHPARMTVFYQYNAINQTSLGDFSLAESYFNKVFQMRAEHFAGNYYGRAVDLRSYGELLDSLRRYEEADQYFLDAIDITRQNFGDMHRSTALYLKYAGDHFLRSGNAPRALDYYQKSLLSLVPRYDVRDPATNPQSDEVQDHLFLLGLLKQKAASLEILARSDDGDGYLRAAFNAYRLSVQLTGSLRTSYLNDQSKLYLSENERNTYENLVKTAYKLYGRTEDPIFFNEAFIAAEKAKYATLVSVLQRSDAIQLAGIPDSIREMESALQKKLSMNKEMLRQTRADTLIDSMRLQRYQYAVFTLNYEMEQLNHELEAKYPDYYNLLYNPWVADPLFVKEYLGRNEKLVEYFMSAEDLYVFEISDRASSFRSIPLDKSFLEDLQTTLEYLRINFLDDSSEIHHEDFLVAANRLYEVLLPGAGDDKKLIIIPEGPLAYLPFDILVTEPVRDFDGMFSKVPFLIKDHPVRYAYSVTLMNAGDNHDHGLARKLVAFAPGYNKTSMTSPRDRRELNIDRLALESLPGTLTEVDEIGSMTRGKAFTGSEASESNFREWAGGSDIIHLAMHAFLDDEDPLQSSLVFSEDSVPGEDGFLNVSEIYNLELNARMVVLSACNTGAGQLRKGEGIMSLARAFLYAGIPNIVMTQWTVSDEQSYKLMLGFYQYLQKGKTTSEALRRAKLDILSGKDLDYQQPQFWAGYISVGGDEIIFPRRIYAWIGSGILIFAGLILAVLRLRKLRKAGFKQVRSS